MKEKMCRIVLPFDWLISGKLQVARGGQSLTLVGSRLIMFGGEDRHRRLMNDVHILDLETMTWDVVATT